VPANIEIKARAKDFARQSALAEALGRESGDDGSTIIEQEDTFFHVPTGRLKLRVFSPRQGELIQYQRADQAGPKESRYTIAPTVDPASLLMALGDALGVLGVVRKRRRLIMCGQTRIHLDEVERLGRFIELEVVLLPGQTAAAGEAIARDLMSRLEIETDDLIETAYLDLLRESS